MRRDALLAAVLAPVAFTSYLLSLGVGVGGVTGELFLATGLYTVILGGVGVLVAETHEWGLLTPLPVATALSLLAPWIGFGATGAVRFGVVTPESLTLLSFLPSVVIVAVLVTAISVLEYAATEHPRAAERLDGRTGVGSIAVGVVYAVAVLGASGLRFEVTLPSVALLLWVTGGLLVLGTVPVYVGVRLNRLSPPAVVAAGLVLVLVTSSEGRFSFSVLYAVGWVVPLGVALVAAAAESRVRHYGAGDPRPRL
ncbi:hypothetical protein [Halopelagius longus]|uniref:Uncharacterized protein n=1 Tax=Halopelagius longus TaxID=1236180 RepID=A0A1H1DYG7_9EURY|nr:hypothetical protein [Halopelagius longus]RDI71527.1 hypothetical protein DWB78_07215 [Halopelagius longus]SDQ81535.1 hypothetical protein SAMN05216278_2647 [Halopelagius longus]